MIYFRISLLLFSQFITKISTSESTSSKPTLKTRKFNHDDDNCVCFPGGHSLHPEILSPQGNGLERLVVYIYRDVNTNEVKLFMPGPKKQALIPNIPFGNDDILKPVTTETIASLIQPNPLIIPNLPVKQAVPIGWQWGTIKDVPSPTFHEVLQRSQTYPQQGRPGQNIIELQMPIPARVLNSAQKQPNGHYATLNNRPSQPQYEVIEVGQNIFTWGSNPLKNVPVNPNQPSDPLGQYQMNTPSKQDIFSPDSLSPNFFTFDQWFNKQMDAFRQGHSPQDIQVINIDALRTLIEKALFDNDMHIGSTGQIADANGVSINPNNLELRPIMIGNSIKYSQVKEQQKMTLPKNLPYLEGILIMLLYPPKILGVIPLGKTYVSQSDLVTNTPSTKTIIYYPGTGSDSIIKAPLILSPVSSVASSQTIISRPTVINSSPSILSPYVNVTSSRLLSPYSNVANFQNPYGQWQYANGLSTAANRYQPSTEIGWEVGDNNPNILHSSANVPSVSGKDVNYITMPDPQLNVPWGQPYNNDWYRRSNKTPKPLQLPRYDKETKPPNDNKRSRKLKSRSRFLDSTIRRKLNTYPPHSKSLSSNPLLNNGPIPSHNSFSHSKTSKLMIPGVSFRSWISNVKNPHLTVNPVDPTAHYNEHYPTDNSFIQSNSDARNPHLTVIPVDLTAPNSDARNLHLTVIPVNPTAHSSEENYPIHNSFIQSHSDGRNLHLTVVPIDPSNEKYYLTRNSHNQLNSNIKKPHLFAIPTPYSHSDDLSNKQPHLIAYPAIHSGKSDSWQPSSHLPPHTPWMSSYNERQSHYSNSPWSFMKTETWPPINPNVISEFSPSDITLASTPYPTYPFVTSHHSIQHKKKQNGIQSRRRYTSIGSVQEYLTTLIDTFLQNLAYVGGTRKKGTETNTTASNPQVKNRLDGDRPDYRIIGGLAATGSGAPLSNKGRSGIIR